jgi:hypothetical protein
MPRVKGLPGRTRARVDRRSNAALLSLAGLLACASVEVQAPAPAPPAPLEQQLPPRTCALSAWDARALGAPPRDLVPAEALRALVGHTLDDPELARAVAPLGEPEEAWARTGERAHLYADAGVVLLWHTRAAGPPVLARVRLALRAEGVRAFGGRLPAGLDRESSRSEVHAVLGAPPGRCDAGAPCVYPARGLALTYAGECLAALDLFPPLAPDEVRVALVDAEVAEAQGVQGLAVTVSAQLGTVDSRAYALTLELRDAGGRLVGLRADVQVEREAPLLGPRRAPQARERDPAAVVVDACAASPLCSEHGRYFVPFRALALPPGAHTLRASVRTVDLGPVDYGRTPTTAEALAAYRAAHTPRALRDVGSRTATITLVMPPLERARVGVVEVEVAPGEYDDTERNAIIGSIATGGVGLLAVPFVDLRKLARPDLTWTLSVGGRVLYRAPARQDVLRARWSQRAPAVTVAVGDRLRLCVEDEDYAFGSARPVDETVGCIEGSLDELEVWAKARRAPAEGKVARLVVSVSGRVAAP